MKLEVKSTDKKANLTNLKLKNKKTIATLGILSSLILFSGCSKEQPKNITPELNTKDTISTEDSNYQETNEVILEGTVYETTESSELDDMFVSKDTVVEIPDAFKYQVAAACQLENYDDPITVGHLESLKGIDGSLFLIMYKTEQLDWLKYCKNLEYLTIVTTAEDTTMFKEIKSLPNLKNIYISSENPLTFNKEDFKFIEKSKNLTELTLEGFYTEPGFIESLTNLKYLSIEVDDINPEIDYSKLTFLDELSFSVSGPYDIAVEFTTKDCNTLMNNGVTIITGDSCDFDTLVEINKKLDKIVASLDINENSTEQEKLDAILIYVLDNLTYDPKLSMDILMDRVDKMEVFSFYDGGNLYGALEKDTAICANYAALVDALAERVDLDMHFVTSNSHAWNLTTIDGEAYYIDATWLDDNYVQKKNETEEKDVFGNIITTSTTIEYIDASDAIEQGLQSELEWYMEDPNNLPETYNQDESHEILHMPTFIKLDGSTNQIELPPQETTYQENTESIDTSKEQVQPETNNYEVKIGNKKWIIPAGAAIGIMAGTSGAAVIHSKKKQEAKRRRREQQRRKQLQSKYPDFFESHQFDTSFDSTYKRY